MCFSAQASFVASGILSATGAVTAWHALRLDLPRGMKMLALFPLIFGVQQGLEGIVWMGIEGRTSPEVEFLATYGFLFFALSFWPIAGPVVGYMVERHANRRRFFGVLVLAGLCVSGYLSTIAVANPVPPEALSEFGGHIAYLLGVEVFEGIEYVYFVTACAALVLSSNRDAFIFGCLLAVSFGVSMLVFPLDVVPSVWCFFAALCSGALVISVLGKRSAPSISVDKDL